MEVPALGYRQIRVHKVAAEDPLPANAPHAHADVLENDHLRITFAPSGTAGILDKDTGQQIFRRGQTGLRAVLLDDHNDTWAHKVRTYDKEVGEFKRTGFKVLEDGPLRARVREYLSYGTSTLTIDWILYAANRKVDLRVSLDWHERLKMLKFSFPVDVEAPNATYEIAYGAQARDTNGDENPGQRWIDVTGTQGGKQYGLAVLNDAKYGYSVNGSDMRVSIARAAVYANHEPRELVPGADYQWMDQGLQTFQMELIPHSGPWQQSGVTRAAEELVTETPIVYQGIHPGPRKQSDSFLSVDSPAIVVEAVKQAEDNDDLIVRSYETNGRETSATLDLGFAQTKWTGTYRPFEIKTLRIDCHTRQVKEVNALEQ